MMPPAIPTTAASTTTPNRSSFARTAARPPLRPNTNVPARFSARISVGSKPCGTSIAGVGVTGVVGRLANGDGPTVMLRADMDALPVSEATGLPYASRVTATDPSGAEVPVMHACGHDMHVTWLAGAAALLAAARDAW